MLLSICQAKICLDDDGTFRGMDSTARVYENGCAEVEMFLSIGACSGCGSRACLALARGYIKDHFSADGLSSLPSSPLLPPSPSLLPPRCCHSDMCWDPWCSRLPYCDWEQRCLSDDEGRVCLIHLDRRASRSLGTRWTSPLPSSG